MAEEVPGVGYRENDRLDRIASVATIRDPQHGSAWYRLIQPGAVLNEMELGFWRCHVPKPPPMNTDSIEYHEWALQIDALEVSLQRCNAVEYYSPSSRQLYNAIKNDRVIARDKGVSSPALFIHFDDLVSEMMPWNPAFRHCGTQLPDGTKLEPGNIVVFDKDGPLERRLIDGQGGFDIARNHRTMETIADFARLADGVIVSTPRLEKWAREMGAEHVYMRPNAIDVQRLPKMCPKVDDSRVRVLWTGGSSHFQDLITIVDALKEVVLAHPEVVFIAWGDDPQGMLRGMLPPEQFEMCSWIDSIQAYYNLLSVMGADIAIAPLEDTSFNDAKSAIKWYETTAILRPSAFIGANIGPYKREVESGVTGLLYDTPKEFAEALTILIEDASQRRDLAMAAHEHVRTAHEIRPQMPAYTSWMLSRIAATRRLLVEA